ncbi:hypothetical protein [Marinobacter mangrovi]|uniref:hypothetical protein n=1 Tax=Marinobacter mangrovi TaxID=2803918 RepID=UPI0019344499|nr:hypothetical protein [Marinobacter mangrovi]
MPINKGETFKNRDVFIDYPFEEVKFRWDRIKRKIFRRFYGEPENEIPVEPNGTLFNDALLYGDEITKEEYFNE